MTTSLRAHFWFYYDGKWIQLRIKQGQEFSFGKAWGHDEGWSSVDYSFAWPAEEMTIYRSVVNDGRDCDGRLTHVDECFVDVCPGPAKGGVYVKSKSAEDCYPYDEGVKPEMIPDWTLADEYQRDYAAEAAGY
jgi:hypothetical protein